MMSVSWQSALPRDDLPAESAVRGRVTLPGVLLYGLIIWLSVEGFLTNRYDTLSVFAFRDLIVLLLYMVLMPRIIDYWRPSFGRALSVAVALFGAVYIAGVFNPALPSVLVGLVGLRDNLWYLPLFVVGYVLLGTEERLARLLYFVAAVHGLCAMASFVQFAGGESSVRAFGAGYSRAVIYTGTGRSFLRVSGLAASPGLAGAAFAIGCICAVMGAMLARDRRQRAVMVAAGLLCFSALLLSGCRTWFGLLLIWFALLWAVGRGRRTWLTVAGLLTAAVFVLAAYGLHAGINDRYMTLVYGETLWSRLNGLFVYRITRILPEAMLGFGSGIASSGSRHFVGGRGLVPLVESDYVRIVYEVGIPGLLCFALLYVLLVRRTWRQIERAPTTRSRSCVAAVLAFQVAALIVMFIGAPMLVQPFPQTFWLMSGAACGLVLRASGAEGQSTDVDL